MAKPNRPSAPMRNVPTFSEHERDRRWALADALMERKNLDALIVYGDRESAFPGSFAPDTWFTNERPGSIVVKEKDREPIMVAFLTTAVEDHIQARATHSEGWIRPEEMYVGKMGSNLVQVLEERALSRAAFGLIGLGFYPPYYFDGPLPYNTYQSLMEDLPEATFQPLDSEFFALQAAKSEEELAVLRYSADVGERVCEAMRQAARPGVPENALYAAALHEAANNLGFTTQILLGSGHEFVGWGPPAWTYRPQAPRVLEEGDVVLSEVFTSFGMLETQHQPTIAIGDVHPDFERAAKAARKSYEAGVSALRAGNTFGAVVEAMNAPMREVDAWHVHPLVHSLNPFGLIGVGDRMADLPEAAEYAQVLSIPTVGTDSELKSGMVFAVEPNCALGRRVVNLGGTVVVGNKGGVELNTNATHMMRAG